MEQFTKKFKNAAHDGATPLQGRVNEIQGRTKTRAVALEKCLIIPSDAGIFAMAVVGIPFGPSASLWKRNAIPTFA